MYCPKCGAETLLSEQNRKYSCSECDFLFFQNVAAATMAVVTQFNEGTLWLLVATRAKDPGKGFYDLPGGFVDPDESAEQALERELVEEIGVKPIPYRYLTSFPNTYPYQNVVYKTCDLVFHVELEPNAKVRADDDVESLEWVPLAEITTEQFAFDSTKRAISEAKRQLLD